MLIEGTSTAVAFLVFVAPGVLWAWLSERRQARIERHDVMTVGLVALTSVVFSLPVAVPVLIVSFRFHLGTDRLIDAFFFGGVDTGDEALRLTLLLLAQLAIACLLVLLCFKGWGGRIFGNLRVERRSHWMYEFEKHKDAGTSRVGAEIFMHGGGSVRGIVNLSSEALLHAEREITLKQPIVFEDAGGSDVFHGRLPTTLTIPGEQIVALALTPIADDR